MSTNATQELDAERKLAAHLEEQLTALTQENQRLRESRESLLRTAQTECSRIAAERDAARREIERLRETLSTLRESLDLSQVIQFDDGDISVEELIADALNAPTPAKPC